MNLEERIRQLRQAKTQIPGILARAGMNAALRAVEKAVEETPPTVNSLRGTNTRTGEMKQHWVTDSRSQTGTAGGQLCVGAQQRQAVRLLCQRRHRMDRHFVPGLVINPGSGLLEFNPDGTGGIVVGTRTAYVPGLFMVDKAVEEYRRVLREELKGLEELME